MDTENSGSNDEQRTYTKRIRVDETTHRRLKALAAIHGTELGAEVKRLVDAEYERSSQSRPASSLPLPGR